MAALHATARLWRHSGTLSRRQLGPRNCGSPTLWRWRSLDGPCRIALGLVVFACKTWKDTMNAATRSLFVHQARRRITWAVLGTLVVSAFALFPQPVDASVTNGCHGSAIKPPSGGPPPSDTRQTMSLQTQIDQPPGYTPGRFFFVQNPTRNSKRSIRKK